eukprot:sb/3469610/
MKHNVVVDDKRPVICEVCQRSFLSPVDFYQHELKYANHKLDEEYEYNDDEEHDEEEDGEFTISGGHLVDGTGAKFEGSDAEGNQRERIGKGITVHECTICNKVFTYRSLFTRHLKSHSTDNSFKCHTCGTKTPKVTIYYKTPYSIYYRDMISGNEGGDQAPYECERCSDKFFTYRDYKHHMTDHIISDQDVDQRSNSPNPAMFTVCGVCPGIQTEETTNETLQYSS